MSIWSLIAQLCLFLLLTLNTNALYTKLGLWSRRCFIEDVPDNTMITFNWALHLFNEDRGGWDEKPSKEGNMYLTITSSHHHGYVDDDTQPADMPGKIRFQQHLTNGFGTVKYFAEEYGQYEWCFEMQPSKSNVMSPGATTARFYIESSRQYQEDAKEIIEETQESIVSHLGRSLRRARLVKMEQRHYKEREQQFRAISYLTSTRVVWYGVITALTVVSTGCFMMMNIRSFFIAKKIV